MGRVELIATRELEFPRAKRIARAWLVTPSKGSDYFRVTMFELPYPISVCTTISLQSTLYSATTLIALHLKEGVCQLLDGLVEWGTVPLTSDFYAKSSALDQLGPLGVKSQWRVVYAEHVKVFA